MENGKFLIFHRGKTLLLSQKSKGMRKDPALASFAQTLEINSNLKSDSGTRNIHKLPENKVCIYQFLGLAWLLNGYSIAAVSSVSSDVYCVAGVGFAHI